MPNLNSQIFITPHQPIDELNSFLQTKPYTSIVIITDSNVYPLYFPSLTDFLKNIPPIVPIILTPGEASKTLENAQNCWQEMHHSGVDRHALVIGLGGGVITDLAGFVAGCYMRGVDVLHIPTTLMGMVDASIGGKTGVNLTHGKNIIGLIHQPKAILISPFYLKSLPQREFVAGLAEVVKQGIINDPELFEMLETHAEKILTRDINFITTIIQRACNAKLALVQQDEKEQGCRTLLNLGHTFAHAIESATNYQMYSHGEAVSIGLSCAFHISKHLKFIEDDLIFRLHKLLNALNLPIHLPNINIETLVSLMYGDKKAVGKKLHLILVKKLGLVKHQADVAPKIVLEALLQKSAIG